MQNVGHDPSIDAVGIEPSTGPSSSREVLVTRK